MHQKSLAILSVAVILLGTVESAAAQNSSALTTRRVAPVYDDRPFDIDREHLPAGYRGHDFRKLYKSLMSKKVPIRDPFESSKEYEERIEQWAERPILGGIPSSSLLALDGGKFGFKVDYNADKEKITISELQLWRLYPETFGWWSILEYSLTDLPRGTGTAFGGSSVSFSRIRVATLAVKLERMTEQSFFMERSEARRALTLSPLFVGRLEQPFVYEIESETTPTLRNREKILGQHRGIVFRVEQVWFYRVVTGEIFKKIVLN